MENSKDIIAKLDKIEKATKLNKCLILVLYVSIMLNLGARFVLDLLKIL